MLNAFNNNFYDYNNFIIFINNLLFKFYDTLLTLYIFIVTKGQIIYKYTKQKFYEPDNSVHIFNLNQYLGKEEYKHFINMIELIKFINDNSDYFIIHCFQYLDVNYVANNFLLNNIDIIKTKYTFILVEIESLNKKYDITNFLHNNITSYYIIDNILFDRNFILWLKFNKYSIDENDYKINIIDNNINNIKLDKKKYLMLSENTYHIEDTYSII
tara:strand:- start:2509 stop:3150 length:642 start_codon:yes stop_codon:yes gene_type:complete